MFLCDQRPVERQAACARPTRLDILPICSVERAVEVEGPRKRWGALERTLGRPSPEAVEPPVAELSMPELSMPEPSVPETSVLSRKEFARQLRREAYQRAKRARAADPRHLALKEAAKQRRRELYQQAKERRKAHEAEAEAQRKVSETKQRAEAKRQLAERVKSVIESASEPGRALAVDAELARQDADVQALIEHLRVESPALAAKHRNFEGDS